MTKSEYGEEYRAHLLEQYKLYVQMADQVSERRMSMNKFFISVNTVLISIASLFGKENPAAFALFALTGLILSAAWYCHLNSYRQLNSGKFAVVHEMEALLPFAPYDVEWQKLDEGHNKKKYWPLSHVERALPLVFWMVYFVFLIWALYSWKTGTPIPMESAKDLLDIQD